MLIVMPRRVASFTACWTSSRHSGAHETHGPLGNEQITFHVDEPTNAHPAHRFEIRRDAFFGEHAVGHHPIDPRPGGLRRLKKCPWQLIGRQVPGGGSFLKRALHRPSRECGNGNGPCRRLLQERAAIGEVSHDFTHLWKGLCLDGERVKIIEIAVGVPHFVAGILARE